MQSTNIILDSFVHQTVTRRAQEHPDRQAIKDGSGCVSYRELDIRADQIAHWLRNRGVRAGDFVGLCLDRGADLITCMLAVLKAGAAYIPMETSYPAGRLSQMVNDAKPVLVLAQRNIRDKFALSGTVNIEEMKAEIIKAEINDAGIGAQSCEAGAVTKDRVAYVIYTSGTTGEPKGVLVSHGGLANYIAGAAEQWNMSCKDTVLQFAAMSFDTAAEEIFVCLSVGGCLVIRDEHIAGTAEVFFQRCHEHKVTVLDLPTAYWHELAAQVEEHDLELPETIRLVVIGGERAMGNRVAKWQSRFGNHARLLNTYGPTETTIVATNYEFPVNWGGDALDPQTANTQASPIGTPCLGYEVYVLDNDGQKVFEGVTGELHIGGEGVSHGYLNRSALTAQSFIPDPFSGKPGSRLYASGDLARWNAAGVLEYMGRADSQVKIRGFRIETGEIESVLGRHSGIREAAVTVHEDGAGAKQLVAYYTTPGNAPLDVAEARGYLRAKLPSFMVPAFYSWLPEMPLNAHGKIDRRVLAAIAPVRNASSEFVPPHSEIEKETAAIWQDVLKLPEVGVHDNFLELGGDSLRGMQVLARLRQKFHVNLPVHALLTSENLGVLAAHVEEAIVGGRNAGLPPVTRTSRDGAIPLSFAQEAVWFMGELSGANTAYNAQFTVRFKGGLNLDVLERTLAEIVRRHEVLRTTFHEVDGRPVQSIHAPWPVRISLLDLQDVAAAEKEQRVEQVIAELCGFVFKGTELPLIRWTVLKLSERDHIFVQVEHHFVHDGWSLALLLREVESIYPAYLAGKPSPLPELAVQFADYAVWQRKLLSEGPLDKTMAYWEKKLAGIPPMLELPTDRRRPPVQSFRGAFRPVELDTQTSNALVEFSSRHGVTLFVTMLAAFKTLIHLYTWQEDMVVGTAVGNRPLQEIESLIGMIVNAVVMRTDLSGNPTLLEILNRVRDMSLESFQHQDAPFEALVRRLHPHRTMSHNPLFQVMFSFHDSRLPDLNMPDLNGRVQYKGNGSAKFDLDVVVMPHFAQSRGSMTQRANDCITMEWEYSTDLFDSSTIDRMVAAYGRVLNQFMANPHVRLLDLALTSHNERQELLKLSTPNSVTPPFVPVHVLVAQQAMQNPDRIAVEDVRSHITYAQLDAAGNQLANWLIRQGIIRGDKVGLCLERSTDLIVCILGVLKAGAAYIPMEPANPGGRLTGMISDARPLLVITEQQARIKLAGSATRLVDLEQLKADAVKESAQPPVIELIEDDVVSIIYTSGTAGTPKGVAVRHASLANYIRSMVEEWKCGKEDAVLQFAPVSFDTATEEVFASLTASARLVIRDERMMSTPEAFMHRCEELRITILDLPTAYWHELSAQAEEGGLTLAKTVRLIVIGGEPVLGHRARRWQRRFGNQARLLNTYGPTESTIAATLHDFWMEGEIGDQGESPIGVPVEHASAYVLDQRLQLSPVGMPGELFLGGTGLSNGYLNRPDLTAEKFIPNPFGKVPGSRMYASGDLAKWLPNGVLEYIGRTDGQIKVRGFRVETGEIEVVLSRLPQVRECAVVLREDTPGARKLIGYVAGAGGDLPRTNDLRKHLRSELPEYMVPAGFVIMDSLPKNKHGKIDRRALPPPGDSRPDLESTYVAPRNRTEQVISAIWKEVLGISQVGIHDNFFDLGGNSLALIKVRSKLRDALQNEIPVVEMFEFPTISALVGRLDNFVTDQTRLHSIEDRARRQREALNRRHHASRSLQ